MSRVPGALISRYARSLFAAARDRKCLDAVRSDLRALDELWKENPELKALLVNPGLSRKKVRAILEAISGRLRLNEISRAFIDVILDKDRLDLLSEVQPVFERLVFEYEGKIAVKVTTAVPVDGEVQRQIQEHLKRKSGKDPVVEWRENPAILGGLVIEWPDHVFDGSLARKVENLKNQLSGNV